MQQEYFDDEDRANLMKKLSEWIMKNPTNKIKLSYHPDGLDRLDDRRKWLLKLKKPLPHGKVGYVGTSMEQTVHALVENLP